MSRRSQRHREPGVVGPQGREQAWSFWWVAVAQRSQGPGFEFFPPLLFHFISLNESGLIILMRLSGRSLFLFLTLQLSPPRLWQVQRPWEIQGSSRVRGISSQVGVGVRSQGGRGALLLPVETDPCSPG